MVVNGVGVWHKHVQEARRGRAWPEEHRQGRPWSVESRPHATEAEGEVGAAVQGADATASMVWQRAGDGDRARL